MERRSPKGGTAGRIPGLSLARGSLRCQATRFPGIPELKWLTRSISQIPWKLHIFPGRFKGDQFWAKFPGRLLFPQPR